MTCDSPGNAGKDPPTLADEIAPAVAELAAEGKGRNEISRALAVSTATVSRAAAIAGVEFDRGPTEVATRTRTEQLAQDRAELAGMAAEIARRAGRRLYIEAGAEVIDPATLTALNRVFGTATDKALTAGMLTDRLDSDDHHGNSLLDQLRGGFDSWAAALADQGQDQIITNPQEGT